MTTQDVDDDEAFFEQLWDTPELKSINRRFRRDPFVAIPALLRAGWPAWDVARAFKSCELITEGGESYIVTNPEIIHAAAKTDAEWEMADVFNTPAEAAQRVADEIAAEITDTRTRGVDDFVEVETYLLGLDSRGEPVRVNTQTHIVNLLDAGDLWRIRKVRV